MTELILNLYITILLLKNKGLKLKPQLFTGYYTYK